ncbi:hypothetical protein ACJZ2D_016117 [Fusarium nematophilum]
MAGSGKAMLNLHLHVYPTYATVPTQDSASSLIAHDPPKRKAPCARPSDERKPPERQWLDVGEKKGRKDHACPACPTARCPSQHPLARSDVLFGDMPENMWLASVTAQIRTPTFEARSYHIQVINHHQHGPYMAESSPPSPLFARSTLPLHQFVLATRGRPHLDSSFWYFSQPKNPA